jgi:hypothetical protein
MTTADTSSYDSGLPILAELEREIELAARRRLERTAIGPAPVTPGRRAAAPFPARRRRLPLTVPRRAVVLAALACLVGASATATVTVWPGGDSSGGERRVLVEAGAGADAHRFTLHARGPRVCTTFLLPDTLDTVCARPADGNGALVRSVVSPGLRYVYGLTGPAATSVAVRAGTRTRSAAPRDVPAEVLTGVPPARGLGWFLVSLPRGRDEVPTVARIDGRGEARTVVDCSLGQLDRRCDGG